MQIGFSKAKVYLAGISSLIVTVGVARFSYTSLLPIMQTETGLSEAVGGWLATSNYMGYMAGVLLAASMNNLGHKFILYRVYLLLTVLSTAAMALTTDVIAWSVLRFIAGVCSSGGLIIASGLILKWLLHEDHRGELGIHFSGVGVSIILTALFVEYLFRLSVGWQDQWLAFAMLAVIFSIPAWLWMPHPGLNRPLVHASEVKDRPPAKKFAMAMLAAYFCAGYGYVVSATFIVDIVEGLPTLEGKGQWTFVLIGIAASGAVLLWDRVARRLGYLKSLLLAYSIQIVGIFLPTVTDHLMVMMLSALLYGGTFIACVSLVLTMAGQLYPSNPAKFMGKMTLAYGIAQIIAPTCTGILAQLYGNYNSGLYLSALVMCGGVAMIALLMKFESQDSMISRPTGVLSNKLPVS